MITPRPGWVIPHDDVQPELDLSHLSPDDLNALSDDMRLE
jgi:hypothetical protein